MKILYTIKVSRKEKVEERTENEDGSFTVKNVDKDVPVEVHLKLPSRRDREEISLVYNAQYGMALGKGLQTADVVKRSLLDSGGIIARQDLERADEILKMYQQKENEIIEAKLEGLSVEDLEQERRELSAQFAELEEPQREIFSRTAEFFAESKTVEWCVLNLSYFKTDKDYYQVFGGATPDSKLTTYYDWCDEEDNKHVAELEAYAKATLVYYHHIMGGRTGEEYFNQLLGIQAEEEKEES